jgi:hypothetical protein
MRFTISLAPLLGLASLALAADFTLYLPPQPAPSSLRPTTHVTLSSLGKQYTATLSAVSTFRFLDVEPGSYLVDVHCQTEAFRPLRLDVGPGSGSEATIEAWETYRGNDWNNKGEALEVVQGSAGRGLQLRAMGSKTYFSDRPKFSVFSIFKDPMILMSLGTMGLFFGMPYIMDKMDPELKAEFEASSRNSALTSMQQGQSPLGNFDMAAYLSGADKKEEAPSSKSQGGKR